jgi:hypothetical protein
MQGKSDKTVHTTIPFLNDRTVLYVDCSEGVSLLYMRDFWPDLRRRFAVAGFTFIYLPELADRLTPDLLSYLFPGSDATVPVEGMYGRIQQMASLGDKSGFLYRIDGVTRFHVIPKYAGENIKEEAVSFIDSLRVLQEPKSIDIFQDAGLWIDSAGIRPDGEKMKRSKAAKGRCPEFPAFNEVILSVEEEEAPCAEYRVPEEEPLDPRTQAILDKWEEIEREFGITIEELDMILGYRVRLSRLRITTDGRILLSDMGDAEVRMNDLSKAVYFYYLRHPEGAALKELQDHEKEILKYYEAITGRGDPAEIRKSVSDLLDPYGNGLNVCVSRIKKAFRDVVGDRVARFYYVDGRYGDKRSVRIDRDLVIWEH